MPEHTAPHHGNGAVIDPLPLPASVSGQCAGVPVVEISTTWFAALRRVPQWKLTVHTGDARLVTCQLHPDYASALDAAVTVCRYLRWGPETIQLAA